MKFQTDVRNMIEMLLEKVSGHWMGKLNYLMTMERQIYCKSILTLGFDYPVISCMAAYQEYQKMLLVQQGKGDEITSYVKSIYYD